MFPSSLAKYQIKKNLVRTKRRCICGGCNELIWDKDVRGRERFFVKGHQTRLDIRYGVNARHWKGGREVTKQHGYIRIYAPNHPRAHRGKVFEHVLVMEKKLGRYLTKNERVHHKNGNPADNRIKNLELTNPTKHQNIHAFARSIKNNMPCPRCQKWMAKDGFSRGRQQYRCNHCGRCVRG